MADENSEACCCGLVLLGFAMLLSVGVFFGVLVSELIHLFNGEGFYPWVP